MLICILPSPKPRAEYGCNKRRQAVVAQLSVRLAPQLARIAPEKAGVTLESSPIPSHRARSRVGHMVISFWERTVCWWLRDLSRVTGEWGDPERVCRLRYCGITPSVDQARYPRLREMFSPSLPLVPLKVNGFYQCQCSGFKKFKFIPHFGNQPLE